MLTLLLRLSLVGLLLPGPAQAEPVAWDLVGRVVNCPSTPEIDALVPCNGLFRGHLWFNDAVVPSSPGQWYLPGAIFHAQIGDLTLDSLGASAWLWPNLDAILFEGSVDSSNVPGLGGTWRIYSITYMDGYFDPNHLPSTPPRSIPAEQFWVDQSLIVWLSLPNGTSDSIGTDTLFGMRRVIPEPSPIAIYFGLGVILISMRLLRGSLAFATRKLVAPRP